LKHRKVEEDYNKLASSLGFKWVGCILPRNTHCKTLWRCGKKHEWFASYNDLGRSRGCCPICLKISSEDYHKLAKSRGFKWVGDVLPKNTHTKSWWECENGHRWLAKYNAIQQGSGCPICNIKTEKDYYELAKIRGFKWIGKFLPQRTRVKTWWMCKAGHKWQSPYDTIKSKGSGCPFCKNIINGAIVSNPQIKLNNLLCGSLNYPEGKYRIDVAIMRKSQKIAVEYDSQYWHKGKEKYDAKRDKFLISRGWKVLHVKSRVLLPTRKRIKISINKILNNNNIVNLYLEDWK